MFARTQRLTLRPAWPEDAPAIAQAIAHESVATKLATAPWPYTLADAEAFVALPRAADDVSCLIVAHDLGEAPRIVGGIGIHPDGTAHEIGYWLTPSVWGRGYATEAGHAMLDIARYGMGLGRLVSGHYVDNPASGRVLRKLGFVPTGRVERRACRARGHAVPCATYTRELVDDDARPARMAA